MLSQEEGPVKLERYGRAGAGLLCSAWPGTVLGWCAPRLEREGGRLEGDRDNHQERPLPEQPSVLLATGARRCEELVLREARRLAAAACSEPVRPTRVVVPSHSLRRHLNARLVAGGPCLGVVVQTLRGLAAEVLDRAGQSLPLGAALVEVLVARAASRRPALMAALGGLEDSVGCLVASVTDLLDAGFESSHGEAVAERLGELGKADDPDVARACALAAVAADVADDLGRLHAGGSAALWRRAVELLASHADSVLPSNGVIVHGFANATGLATDLLEALVARLGARAVMDLPSDPAAVETHANGEQFTQRLRERLAGSRGERHDQHQGQGSDRVRWLKAVGVEGEVRAVAGEIQALLARGVLPESIGVVARQPAVAEAAVAVVFSRQGIPFTLEGGRGLAAPGRRRIAAWLRVLERGSSSAADSWLGMREGSPEHDDLRTALRVAGVTTLEELAGLSIEDLVGSEERLPLPVRVGLDAVGEGGDARLEARRRWLPRSALEQAVLAARGLCGELTARPVGTAAALLATARDLAARMLGPTATARELDSRLVALAAELPDRLELEWRELLVLVRRALDDAGRETAGGRGAGVRVLGVTQARGLTFDHLFVMGLNRGVFPRVVSEDPLLPDWVRSALLPVLPDLEVKALGHDEEQYLFAALLGAAAEVTLSYQTADDEGKEVPASPFVQRLLPPATGVCGEVPAREELGPSRAPALAAEHAVEAGLGGDRDAWEALVNLALAAREPAPGLAAFRRRVIDEIDPDLRSPRSRQIAGSYGPYLGAVGPVPVGGELEGHLYVTTLEAMARCAWKTFLGRILRLEQGPSPADELGRLPAWAVGSVVHDVLAAVGGRAGGDGTWESAVLQPPHAVAWPAPPELQALAWAAASRVGRLLGIATPGLRAALAGRALPWLEVASTFAATSEPAVLGVEVAGQVRVQDGLGRSRSLRFACDRIDRQPDGGIVGTDFKTGRPLSTARQEVTRRRHLLGAIRRGLALQGPAYARAAGERGSGRYVFLDPAISDDARALTVEASDDEAVEAFETVLTVLLGMWDDGLFAPRLAAPGTRETPEACASCELVEACLQRDSGARRRLADWAESDAGRQAAGGWWELPLGRAGEGGAP